MFFFKQTLIFGLALLIQTTAANELTDAAKSGDLNSIIRLIDSGMDVDLPTNDGTTALAYAARRNDLEMVEYLLNNAEADISLKNDYGATALYMAAANADPDLITILLKAGANPDVGLISGETPLMAATDYGRINASRVLLEYGANPDIAENNRGQNALMWAAAEGHIELAGLLLRGNANVNARSNSGYTPLLFAARGNHINVVKLLLDAGANIEDTMCKTGSVKRIRYEELNFNNSNIETCDSGLDALMISALGGFVELAEVLLTYGADPNNKDKQGRTVLFQAVGAPAGITRSLLKHGADPNVRFYSQKQAARFGSRVTLEGATPLVAAANVNNLDVFSALLEAGADPFLATEQNTTALLMAAGAGTSPADSLTDEAIAAATEIVKKLVKLGADVNATGPYGWTALHAAAYHGRNDIIQLLIENGANPNFMDNFGQTPLSIAYAIVTEGMGDNYNQTPRIFRKQTAELLLSMGALPIERSGVKVVAERAIE